MIEEAEDGQKAVERFAESEVNCYNLILMDIQMPHVDESRQIFLYIS